MRLALRPLLLTVVYVAAVAALPWPTTPQKPEQAVIAAEPPAASPSSPTPAAVAAVEPTDCGRDELRCGDICYDPTEAECDPEFDSITLFGPYLSKKKKQAREKARKAAAADEKSSSTGQDNDRPPAADL
ncbi:hypothetical protein Dda_8059 [Drechslerella dactyloides]|uniref:Uncharacterized protein n=1 Tax=Drechslerella dactyloides TaxID=74499 RepID=A0AAD6IRL5_DREDA|nr:hypothetical protein Dda_8059 [Drechslerella dactyloides]